MLCELDDEESDFKLTFNLDIRAWIESEMRFFVGTFSVAVDVSLPAAGVFNDLAFTRYFNISSTIFKLPMYAAI